MWRNISSVSVKFLIILIPILALTTAGFSAVFFYAKYADLGRVLSARIAAIAGMNAVALSNSLWSFDAGSTEHIIQAISVNREIRCIEVSDDLAGALYLWPKSGCDRERPVEAKVSHDIHVQSRRLGSITLHYSFDSVRDQVRAEVVNSIGLLMLLLVGTVVTALMAHRITIGVPLARLIQSIRLAEAEHVRKPVQWSSADELGRVILAYNRMLERLAAEEAALRKSEQRLSLAITATRSSVWDIDLRTRTFWRSAEFPAMLGYGPDELPMTTAAWRALIHPEELPGVLALARRHLKGAIPAFEATYRMRHKDGSWIWIEDRATAIRDADGRAVRLTGIMADVTERIRARAALARERAILQATLESLDQGVFMVDRDLNLTVSNRRVAELLDLPTEFLARRPTFHEVVRLQVERGEFAEPGSAPEEGIEEWLGGPRAPTVYKQRRPNGTVLKVYTNPLPEGGFVRTYTDVTVETHNAEEMFMAMQATEGAYAELKETQASLVQAEKLASLGLLVAGIAHEINTPVGIAFGCATHLSGRTRELLEAFDAGTLRKSDLKGYVVQAAESSRLMLSNLTRAAELIQSFKQVAVDQTSAERRRFNLKTYIEEVIVSLGPRLRATSHTVTVSCPESLDVHTFPGALSQVLTNLVMNALVHAFDGRQHGRIVLAVTSAFSTGDGPRPTGDGDVELRFSDDGRGIPPENLSRIFEPFFTTRRGTGGSGLGLHIVFNLVTQSLGGRIAVDSIEGGGTTFMIRIPSAAPARHDPGGRGAIPASPEGVS